MQFFNTTFGLIVLVGGVLAVAVVGLLYVIGLFKKGKDGEDDRLIKILQETVETLEKKVDKQKVEHDETVGGLTKKIDSLTEKVDQLERENKTLTEVLQGRDKKTQEFYEKAFKSIEIGEKTYNLVKTMNTNHESLMKLLIEHLKPTVTITNQQP